VGRPRADDPRQLLAAVDHHLLAQQYPVVVAADLLEVEKAVLERRHYEADFVHVGGEHDGRARLRAGTSLEGNDVAEGVGPHLVSVAAEQLQDDVTNLLFVSRDSVGF